MIESKEIGFKYKGEYKYESEADRFIKLLYDENKPNSANYAFFRFINLITEKYNISDYI